MPRIRKKTSNRQSTQQRAKIHHKAAETRRKTRKAAKKNPQWKSKKKADPGIPNSFPFKDQILAEVAEQRRQDEAAKIARKEAARNGEDEKEVDTPGIASLHVPSVYSANSSGSKAQPETVTEEAPVLVDTSLATLQDVLDRADVVLQVVDARDIAGGRSLWLERLLDEAEAIHGVVITKTDVVPRESLEAWLPHLPENTFLFSSPPITEPSSSSSTQRSFIGRSELLSSLTKWSTAGKARDGDLRVALMGLPSVGKTSVLNALLPETARKHTVAPLIPAVSSAKNPQPTTKAPIEVSLELGEDVTVRVIDTPGWDLVPDDLEGEEGDVDMEEAGIDEEKWDALEEIAVGDVLRRNLGRVDRIKDVLPLASWIVKRANPQDLMLAYNVPFFQSGDVEAFLKALARANGRFKKGEQPDIEAGARILLRDWALNQLPYYSVAPKSKTSEQTARNALKDVLASCRSKKEMRSTGKGLVRMTSGEAEQREIILDDDYTAAFEPSEDGSDSDDIDMEDDDEDDVEEDDDEEDEDDEFTGDVAALEGLAEEEDEDHDIQLDDDEEEETADEAEVEVEAFKKGKQAGRGVAKGKGKKVSFGDIPLQESEREVKMLQKAAKGRAAPKKRGSRK